MSISEIGGKLFIKH